MDSMSRLSAQFSGAWFRRGCVLSGIFFGLFVSNLAWGQFTPIAGWEQQLFPSYLFATAALKGPPPAEQPLCLGDPSGLFGVSVVAPADQTPITVTVTCEEFWEVSEFRGTLAQAGSSYTIHPKIKYRYQRLGQCRQATPATVTFRVQLGDQPAQEDSLTITVRSLNDCPFTLQEGEQLMDLSSNFTAYVNEQHPFVDKLLREALDLGWVDSFDGYAQNDAATTIRQVYALWDLMVARDVRYSSITRTAVQSDSVGAQHVRLLEDTINNTQANCVDGSVLFCSLLRKVGIDSLLILEPGHCYVGWWATADHKIFYAMETTFIGQNLELPADVPEEFAVVIAEEDSHTMSWGSFVNALLHGSQRLVQNGEKFKADPAYRLIDISEARRAGFLPIPFAGQEEFLAFNFWDEDGEMEDQYDTEDLAEDGEEMSEDSEADTGEDSEEEAGEDDGDTEDEDAEDYADE